MASLKYKLNGEWIELPMFIGEKGQDGKNGLDGLIGADGRDLEFIWDNTRLGIRKVGDLEYVYVDLKGDRGIQGLTGEVGLTGSVGLTGERGEQGIRGEAGLPGTNGVQGVKGEKGDIGLKGDKGGQGIQGLRGEKGEKGDSGTKPIIPCTSWGVILGNVAICWGKGDTNEHGEYSLQYPTIGGRKVSYDDEAILTATYEEMLSSSLIPLRAYGGSGAWGLVRGSDYKTIMWQSVGKLIDSREAEDL